MSPMTKSRAWLLPALCLAGLAANVSGRTLEPLISVISAEFSVGVAIGALLTSFYALPFALGQPLLGPMGDIYGKQRTLKICLWILTMSLFGAASATSFDALSLARIIAGFAAGGVVPACMATIGDAYPPEKRQVAISIFVTMGMMAQIFATSASGLLGETIGWRMSLLGTAIIALIGTLAATFILKTPQRTSQDHFSVGLALGNYKLVFRNPKAVLCYSTVFLEGIGLYGILPYMGDLLSREGEARITEAGIVIGALGAGGLVYVACVSSLLKFFHRRHFMWVGGLLMIVGPVSLALHLEWRTIAAAFAITGLGFMLLHNSIQTEAVELAPAARQSAYSLHAFCFFTGQASGPPLFGAAVMILSEPVALCLSAFILATTGISMSILFGRLARGEQQAQ